METVQKGEGRRRRVSVGVTLDPDLVEWLRSWGGDRPLSQKLDAAIAFLRAEVEGQVEALATPAGDSLLAFQKLRREEDLAPDEVRALIGAMLARAQEVAR